MISNSLKILFVFLFISIEVNSQPTLQWAAIYNAPPGNGWFSQNSGTITDLNSLKFIDLSNGWCIGDSGKVLKTSNGGDNWEIQEIGYSINLKVICFPSVQYNENRMFQAKVKIQVLNGNSAYFDNVIVEEL
ncbi:MAG: hypothetical protein IPM38_11920 [Ignavibacteria bacterium]|nr:hypothetical protein [Ignavibacteria bacterium]